MDKKQELANKKCTPCQGGVSPLKGDKLKKLLIDLNDEWEIKEEKYLEKLYTFPNFKKALHFVDLIGNVAEEEGHHPDIFLSWGKVIVKIWTHKIGGLTENDFILAAKCDNEYAKVKTDKFQM